MLAKHGILMPMVFCDDSSTQPISVIGAQRLCLPQPFHGGELDRLRVHHFLDLRPAGHEDIG